MALFMRWVTVPMVIFTLLDLVRRMTKKKWREEYMLIGDCRGWHNSTMADGSNQALWFMAKK